MTQHLYAFVGFPFVAAWIEGALYDHGATMLTRLVSRRLARQLPIFRLLAVGQVALLGRRHLRALTPEDRRRLTQLVRGGRNLTPDERTELRALAGKLEPRAFALAAADKFSPFPLPERFRSRR